MCCPSVQILQSRELPAQNAMLRDQGEKGGRRVGGNESGEASRGKQVGEKRGGGVGGLLGTLPGQEQAKQPDRRNENKRRCAGIRGRGEAGDLLLGAGDYSLRRVIVP